MSKQEKMQAPSDASQTQVSGVSISFEDLIKKDQAQQSNTK